MPPFASFLHRLSLSRFYVVRPVAGVGAGRRPTPYRDTTTIWSTGQLVTGVVVLALAVSETAEAARRDAQAAWRSR